MASSKDMIINPLLIKLDWSRWRGIGLVLCLLVNGSLHNESVFHKTIVHNLFQICRSLNPACATRFASRVKCDVTGNLLLSGTVLHFSP